MNAEICYQRNFAKDSGDSALAAAGIVCLWERTATGRAVVF